MQLDFGDREPQDLEILPGYNILLGLWLNGSGAIEEKAYTRISPPPEADLLVLFKRAAVLSGNIEEKTSTPVYIAQRLIEESTGAETIQPIALYYGGLIEEYCRPPWRVSENVL